MHTHTYTCTQTHLYTHTRFLVAFQILFLSLSVKTRIFKWRTYSSHFKKQMSEIIAKNPGIHGLKGKQRHHHREKSLHCSGKHCPQVQRARLGEQFTVSKPEVQISVGFPLCAVQRKASVRLL